VGTSSSEEVPVWAARARLRAFRLLLVEGASCHSGMGQDEAEDEIAGEVENRREEVDVEAAVGSIIGCDGCFDSDKSYFISVGAAEEEEVRKRKA